MPLFEKKPTTAELEERKEYLTVESEVESKETEIAELKALKREARSKHGRDWKSKLGLRGKIDLQSLRSVLSGMNKGLRGAASATHNPNLSPLPRRKL